MKLQVPCSGAWSLDSNFNYPAATQYKKLKNCEKTKYVGKFHTDNAVYILHGRDNTTVTCQCQALNKSKTKLATLLYYTSMTNKAVQ